MSKGRVWITGGGTGIGKELAKIFCNNGYNVIISGRRKEKLLDVARHNKKKIFPFKHDVSNLKETSAVAKKIIKKFKSIDLLILNAAIYSPGSLKEISPVNAKKVIDINLIGAINCLPTIVNMMKREKKGHIMFISSPAGYRGMPGAGLYGVTKSGLTFLAETLKIELEQFNIKIQVVHPGFVKTPMTDKNTFSMPFLMSPEDAARKIFSKIHSNNFEIYFPKILLIPMKILSFFPYKLYFFLIKKFIKLPG
ncbi:MAG: short-chain dehydrogenase [Alphaproteobacteria bacterium]|nr:short-chain dehydrogenase [Alphaproteobacteria bacterium]